ncbi:MAG: hypothetical protein SCALA702_05100 [Melioribacteraceae bacterium]|nr:MAG: hypothetical protein SCALA702_05100 [Melioribacteraceae bacterium]
MHKQKILLLVFLLTSFLSAQNKVIFNSITQPHERDEKRPELFSPIENNDDWSLIFDYPFGPVNSIGGYQGGTFVEATGTMWASDAGNGYIYEFSADGVVLDSFTVSGVNYITGMTSDLDYVYAVVCNYYIYKIDPHTRTLAGTINPAVNFALASLAFDPDADNGSGGFWVTMWDHDIVQIDRQGYVLDEIDYNDIYPLNIYGLAYDNVTDGGPFLWVMDFNNSWNTPQYIRQINLNTQSLTSFSHTITDDIGVGESYRIGQDLFLTTSAIDGLVLLGGTMAGSPQDHLFGYDIGSTAPQAGPGIATSPMPEPYAQNISIENNPTIMWENPAGAVYNKVYFGTSLNEVAGFSPNALVADGSSGMMLYSDYHADDIDYSSTYYWRIVEFDATDSTRGPLWRFSTRIEPAPLAPENIMAVWNESADLVSVSWENPTLNIYDEPIEVDSAYIYADGEMVGASFGNSNSFIWHNPPSGIFEMTVAVFDDDFMSEYGVSVQVGVDVYVTTFQFNNLNLEIPDNNMTPLVVPVTIPETNAQIEKIIVSIDTLTHTFVSDLDIFLQSPDEVMVELSTDNGGSGNDVINMILDDDATMPIQGAQAPFTGTWYPEEELVNFMNKPANGEWNLYIFDDYSADEGILHAWSITFITNEPISGNGQLSWDLPFNVYNTTDNEQMLNIGEAPSATDSIDVALGENTLPPMPPLGIFDARMVLPVNPVEYSWKDYRSSSNPENGWKLNIQAETNSYPVTVEWDTSAIPDGIGLQLMDAFTGTMINVDMTETNMVVIDNPAISQLQIQKSLIATMAMPVASGWNIVSVPMVLEDMSGNSVFQHAVTEFFGYDDGYFMADELGMGEGYWVKFDQSYYVEMTGSLMMEDYVMLEEGWNLIGVHHYDVAAEMMYTEPAGIIQSAFFGFNETYFPAEELHACIGYWVKSSEAGKLYMPEYMPAKREYKTRELPQNRLVVNDASGKIFTLYLADGIYSENKQLPPAPPVGIADVRFEDDTFISDQISNSIKLSSVEFPIRVSAAGSDVKLSDPFGGRFVNSLVRDGESVTIDNENISSLVVSSVEIPANFALEQNYPNPFNPATTIKFSLPEKQNVTITIYNALGEQVRNIISGEFDAGYHTVNFNAADLSSGVYIYRINAGNFSDVKKMMLLK